MGVEGDTTRLNEEPAFLWAVDYKLYTGHPARLYFLARADAVAFLERNGGQLVKITA